MLSSFYFNLIYFLSAVQNGNIELVKELLEQGTDVEVKNESGWTPLITGIFLENK